MPYDNINILIYCIKEFLRRTKIKIESYYRIQTPQQGSGEPL